MTVVVERAGEVLLIAMSRGHKRNAVDRDLALGLDAALNRLERERGLLRRRADRHSDGLLGGDRHVRPAREGDDPRRRVRGDPARPDQAADRGGRGAGGRRRLRDRAGLRPRRRGRGRHLRPARGPARPGRDQWRALPRPRALPRHIATELLLTGATLSARRGYDLGLVNRVVPPGTALAEAVALAGEVALSGPVAVAETLRALQELTREDDARGWEVTDRAKSAILVSDDAAEGRAAFAEKRAPRWEGR